MFKSDKTYLEDKKVMIKNGLLFSIAPFLPKVVSVFLLPVMTKYLTAVDYGVAGVITAYSQSIGAFATLGLSIVLMNSFYKDPDGYKDTWQKIYGFLNGWMIVYALIQALILYMCIPEEALDNRWWIIILTNFSTVFFGPTAQIGNSYFVYTKQSVPIIWRSILSSFITLFATFGLVVYLRAGYMGWYVGGFIGTFFSNATYLFVVRYKLKIKPTLNFKLFEIKSYLTVSMPTIPHYYTSYLLEGSGKMILDQNNVAQNEIGQLSITQQIGDMFQMGITGINNAFSPYCMTSIREKDSRKMNVMGRLYVFIVFSAAFVLSIWVKEIFAFLLSNEELAQAYPYAIMYIMALCYRPLYCFATFYYFYYEKTKQLLAITFVSGCIAMALYLFLIPFLGVWAFLIGHYLACLYFGYSGFMYSCYKEHKIDDMPYVGCFFLQLTLTAVAYLLVEQLIAKIIVTFFLLLAISCLFKVYFSKNL